MSCRLSHIVDLMAIMLATSLSPRAESEEVLRLGGVRKVTATVSEPDGTYRIAVEMLPVRAFDPATNRALNLSKGQMYAAQALGKHLKMNSLAMRGLEIRESCDASGSFRLVVVVPRAGVSAAGAAADAGEHHWEANTTTRPPAGTPELGRNDVRLIAVATTTDFLNRKADYLDTIVWLRQMLCQEGMLLEGRPMERDDFDDSIVNIEERSEAAFKALARQIDSDHDELLLLSVEVEELRPALGKAHARVLESLKAAVARFDQRLEKTVKEDKR